MSTAAWVPGPVPGSAILAITGEPAELEVPRRITVEVEYADQTMRLDIPNPRLEDLSVLPDREPSFHPRRVTAGPSHFDVSFAARAQPVGPRGQAVMLTVATEPLEDRLEPIIRAACRAALGLTDADYWDSGQSRAAAKAVAGFMRSGR